MEKPMKQKKTVQCILLGFAAASMHAQGAAAANSGTIEKTDKYTLVLAKQGQENNYTLNGGTEVKPLNSLIIAANGGTNNITIKGKLADGPADAPPTIDNNSIERNINKNGYTYAWQNWSGAVMLVDQSYEGENKVTFENVTIAATRLPAFCLMIGINPVAWRRRCLPLKGAIPSIWTRTQMPTLVTKVSYCLIMVKKWENIVLFPKKARR